MGQYRMQPSPKRTDKSALILEEDKEIADSIRAYVGEAAAIHPAYELRDERLLSPTEAHSVVSMGPF
jgi:hypothetical protein